MKEIKDISANIELVSNRSTEDFREFVHKLVSDNEEELGVKAQRVGFRKMRTKWGSCSSRGNLNFNSHMSHLPDRIIEYIVFHEMVHLIELNHSQRFWNKIKRKFPEHKQYDSMLAVYWSLIQDQCHLSHS